MDRRMETPEQGGTGLSRDMPDQQAGAEEDRAPAGERTEPPEGEHDDVPDTDVPGTGRRGAASRPAVRADQPDPDEPAD